MPELYSLVLLAIPMLLLVWLVLTRRNQTKAFESFQASLAVGQEVLTTSGLLGRIVALDNVLVHLEVAPTVVLRFDRRAIAPHTLPTISTEQE
ncbi:preprotein translocase subunit YajC [Kribbia dieselivorans]|uniref:preprotein translocase subunit YajC n=1 Tax=Kribbia dieselivorans TaxID=331526 RepID=UPI000839A494|nr:preprotein translocase subunit YajC [Kribbia dieselivorans]